MSHTPSTSDQHSRFRSIFDAASRAYTEKTGKDLTSHPLLAKLTTCGSADAITTMLRQQIPAFGQPASSDDRLTKALAPIVKVLNSFSATIGSGIGLVSLRGRVRVIVQDQPSDIDFVGISSRGGYLYRHWHPPHSECLSFASCAGRCDALISQAAQTVVDGQGALVELFERIGNFLSRLEIYTDVPPMLAMTEIIVKVMVEVLFILAIATREIERGKASESICGDV